MTPRRYFGKMNSSLGSVVPLAMFIIIIAIINIIITILVLIMATRRLENGTWATQSSHRAQLVVGVPFVVCWTPYHVVFQCQR